MYTLLIKINVFQAKQKNKLYNSVRKIALIITRVTSEDFEKKGLLISSPLYLRTLTPLFASGRDR